MTSKQLHTNNLKTGTFLICGLERLYGACVLPSHIPIRFLYSNNTRTAFHGEYFGVYFGLHYALEVFGIEFEMSDFISLQIKLQATTILSILYTYVYIT